MPLVSIIVPAFNAMRYLPHTMNSVWAQTFTDFEILVINDGSSDDIEAWYQTQSDPRLQLISQANQGLASARNTGIFQSKGEYLSFLDADDLWLPAKLEKQVQILQDQPEVGLVYTGVENINEAGTPTGRRLQHNVEGWVWERLTQHNYIESGSVAMVRRECFETCGDFDRTLGSYLEDWDMWLRIAHHYPFRVIPDVLVQYRQHAASASKNWDAMARSFELVMAKNFTDPTEPLDALRQTSMGHFYLYCLAWKPLQCEQPDYRQAVKFQQQSFQYDASLKYSRENLRLSIAIILMRVLGASAYGAVLKRIYQLRRFLKRYLWPNTQRSAHG